MGLFSGLFGGGGTGGGVKSPTTTTDTETRTVTGGAVQATGPVISGLSVAESGQLDLKIESVDANTVAEALGFGTRALEESFGFAEVTGARAQEAYQASLESLGAATESLGKVYESALDRSAETSAQVAQAYQGAAGYEGKINADTLLRQALLGAAVLVVAAAYFLGKR